MLDSSVLHLLDNPAAPPTPWVFLCLKKKTLCLEFLQIIIYSVAMKAWLPQEKQDCPLSLAVSFTVSEFKIRKLCTKRHFFSGLWWVVKYFLVCRFLALPNHKPLSSTVLYSLWFSSHLSELLTRAQLPTSYNSFRIGRATTAGKANIDQHLIKNTGRWSFYDLVIYQILCFQHQKKHK